MPDATVHAETVAFRRAGLAVADHHNEGGELRGATLHSTFQPCGMCTVVSIWSKVGRILFRAGRNDVHRMYFETRHIETLDFIAKACRADLTLTDGGLREDCVRLYYPPDAVLSADHHWICRQMSLAVCSNVAAAFVVWLDYILDRSNGCLPKAASPAGCAVIDFTHSNFKRATNLLLAWFHSLVTAANPLF